MAYAHKLTFYNDDTSENSGYVEYNVTPEHWYTAWKIGTVVSFYGSVYCSKFASYGLSLKYKTTPSPYGWHSLYTIDKTFVKGKKISFTMQFTITKEFLYDTIFEELSKRSPVSVIANHHISLSDGIAVPNSDYRSVLVYEVTPGEIIVIGATTGTETMASYMFQNSSVVPTSGVNTSLVGSPVSLPPSHEYSHYEPEILSVPTGATHLVITGMNNSSKHGVVDQRTEEFYFTFSINGVDSYWDPIYASTAPSEDIGNGWLITNRLPPVPDVSFSDLTVDNPQSATARFGGFVQRQSPITASIEATLDPIDPALSITQTILTISQNDVILFQETKTTDDTFSIGTLNVSGDATWVCHITDSAGSVGTKSGTIALLSYSVPSISIPYAVSDVVERWGVDLENNHIPLDDGTNLWCSFEGSVFPITGNGNTNPWSVKIEYSYTYQNQSYTVTKVYNSDTSSPHALATDSDENDITFLGGESFSYRRVESVIAPPSNTGGVFAETVKYEFSVTVTDWFGNSAFLYGFLQTATAFFDVERHGVAVGMRSTGTQETPKFECAYPAYFYGGIVEGGNKYSDVPSKIGQWRDTVYSVYRVIVPFIGSATSANFTAPSVIQRIVNAIGCGLRDNGAYWIPIPFASGSSINHQASFRCSINGNVGTVDLIKGSSQSFTADTIYAVVEFVC